jgi:DNA-binding NtrC family response regulator
MSVTAIPATHRRVQDEMTHAVTGKTVVLIVDDEPLIMMSVADYMADSGFEPIEALTGDEALSILSARSDIDIVFTDVNMPGRLDGLALSHVIGDRWPVIHTVVTSGKVRPERSELADHVVFIPRPYDLERVVRLFTGFEKPIVARGP